MRPNYPLLEGERRPVSERGLILAWIGDGRSEKGNWRGVELEVGEVRNSVAEGASWLRDTTAVLREARATLPESSSRPLPATLAQSRNLAHASLKTTV